MRGFYKIKPKKIKCIDCKIVIDRLTPNHKRCSDCNYIKKKERATQRMKDNPEINRANFNRWYQQNIYEQRKIRRERSRLKAMI